MANHFVWVDIPVTDLDRAIRFYSAVIGAPVSNQSEEGFEFGLLPYEEGDVVGGDLYRSEDNRPSKDGPLVYLNCDGRLDEAIGAVEEHGGEILRRKHETPPHGWRAIVADSEGNRIVLHSHTP